MWSDLASPGSSSASTTSSQHLSSPVLTYACKHDVSSTELDAGQAATLTRAIGTFPDCKVMLPTPPVTAQAACSGMARSCTSDNRDSSVSMDTDCKVTPTDTPRDDDCKVTSSCSPVKDVMLIESDNDMDSNGSSVRADNSSPASSSDDGVVDTTIMSTAPYMPQPVSAKTELRKFTQSTSGSGREESPDLMDLEQMHIPMLVKPGGDVIALLKHQWDETNRRTTLFSHYLGSHWTLTSAVTESYCDLIQRSACKPCLTSSHTPLPQRVASAPDVLVNSAATTSDPISQEDLPSAPGGRTDAAQLTTAKLSTPQNLKEGVRLLYTKHEGQLTCYRQWQIQSMGEGDSTGQTLVS